MEWFKRLFGKQPAASSAAPNASASPRVVPLWAAALGAPDRYHIFMGLVERYFRGRYSEYRVDPDCVWVGDFRLSLVNLAQSCAQEPVEDWRGLIAAYFDLVERTAMRRGDKGLEEPAFAEARPRLRVRLWPNAEADAMNHVIIRKEAAPGLAAVVMLDRGETMTTVAPDALGRWEMSADAVFGIALDNVTREVQYDAIPCVRGRAGGPLILTSDSHYTSSLLLRLADLPECGAAHGCLVAAPTRGSLLVLPINSGNDYVEWAPGLAASATLLHGEGPLAVSPLVWWFRRGTFTELPYTVRRDGRAVLTPPQDVRKLLRELGV